MQLYKYLGAFTARYRLLLIAGWIAAMLGVGIFAPRISEVTTSDIGTFLPEDAPFREALRIFTETFPLESSVSSFLVVVNSPDGILSTDETDFDRRIDTPVGQWLNDLKQWLAVGDIASNITRVITPLDSVLMSQQLVAANNQVALININLTDTDVAKDVQEHLTAYFSTNTPDGVETYITGSLAISQSTSESSKETAESTLVVTIILVVTMLLVIYRSPVSPLLPLSAVTLAYIIAQGVVASLCLALDITISTYANVLLVVVLFGAGTDYCLFLISRYREEMADTSDTAEATTNMVEQVGETIVSSAGTIFVGFIAMSFAEMGLFNTAGPVLAIGIVIMLLVGVTFVPAVLALLGKRIFWSGKVVQRTTGSYYGRVSEFVSSRPIVSIVVIIALMMPLAIYGFTSKINYDLLGDLPDDDSAVVGYYLVRDNFGAGVTAPLNVVLTGRNPDTILEDIDQLSAEIMALPTVGDVRSLDNPLGKNSDIRGLTRVDGQINLIIAQLADMGGVGGGNQIDLPGIVQAFEGYINLLVEEFPVIADDPNLIKLQEILSRPLLLLTQRDALQTSLEGLAATFSQMDGAYIMPSVLKPLLASADATQADLLEQLNMMYLAGENTAFQLTVIVNINPNSHEALDTVQTIRSILTGYGDSSHAAVSGTSSIVTDIRTTMDRDFLRTMGLVIFGIFVVLLFMLHSLIAPVYLILTVVITYAFTLGLTDFVFGAVFGLNSLSWYMPFFTFIFLVALGVDYSIFLIGRVKEEVPQHGTREGVHKAVAATGAVISSAGIILAGTFAALMSGSIMGLIQLGFAVGFGVLVDTFVVRTMLVPAITVLLGKWAWWPGS